MQNALVTACKGGCPRHEEEHVLSPTGQASCHRKRGTNCKKLKICPIVLVSRLFDPFVRGWSNCMCGCAVAAIRFHLPKSVESAAVVGYQKQQFAF